MSPTSRVIEKILRLFGDSKGISEKRFYDKMRKSAIRSRREKPRFCAFLGVRTESGIYCGMRYLVFVPREVESAKTIMYLHGSLYVNPYRRIQTRFAAELAKKTHCRVFFPLYPKLPISTVLPCFALLNNYYAFLRKKGEVLLIGDGSGATLALALCAEREDLRSVIAISPWLCLHVGDSCRNITSDAMLSLAFLDRVARLWGEGVSSENARVSPFFGDYPGKEIVLFVGECELFRPDVFRFFRRQSEIGAQITYYEGKEQQHCYPLFPSPEGRAARRVIIEKMQRMVYEVGV